MRLASCQLRLYGGLVLCQTVFAAIIPPSGSVSDSTSHNLTSALRIEASLHYEAKASGLPFLPIPTHEIGYQNVLEQSNSRLSQAQTVAREAAIEKIMQDIVSGSDFQDAMPNKRTFPPDQRQRTPPIRILIVGDSITNGMEGDPTWRYRLWEWLRSQYVNFRLVGPFNGTFQSPTALAKGKQGPPQPPPTLYHDLSPDKRSWDDDEEYMKNLAPLYGPVHEAADPEFYRSKSNRHFAVWGRMIDTDKDLIERVLDNYPADIMLVALAVNDIMWGVTDGQGTVDSLKILVDNARKSNPNLKFAIANCPEREALRGTMAEWVYSYNELLPGNLLQWSTPRSPIMLVNLQEHYACRPEGCPASYDGLHPNAWGEYQIAHAFSKALVDGYGVGDTPLQIPERGSPAVTRHISIPEVHVFSSPQGVTATWDYVYGAYGYEIDVKINGAGGGYSADKSDVPRWDSRWPVAGWEYEVRVRVRASDGFSDWSEPQSAIAWPELAPPPENIALTQDADQITVTWDPPRGNHTDEIVEYNVFWWADGPNCWFLDWVAFTDSPAIITGLDETKQYFVAPVTWNKNGEGLPPLPFLRDCSTDIRSRYGSKWLAV